ncbi:LPS export ABC transporter periplasmic protein LptC [Pacificoceanicola onchidii]|uniref:LPS export ABC transporter periplasmic protein LptC n=1 Tax=Pacificoceanicola onchidii TaxID=2562685 RepID=UPI0010A4DF25|nr:LPS export ABC transporter periplasmic protein LptC [Pacificoceanicola onchidii]
MARADGLYSRVISWLKILLPLIALVLLSTLFLLSRSAEQVLDVPFTGGVAGDGVNREQVSAPYYAGTTENGDTLTITASTASPEGNGVIRAQNLAARVRMPNGNEIALKAETATVRESDQWAELEGGVRIESSTGYTLVTETLGAAVDRIEAESGGPVSGSGPLGTLEAGKMRIEPLPDSGDVQLLFTDGVKLVYSPQD